MCEKAPYVPVPVEAAKSIAEKFNKAIVIIFAYDENYGMLYTTTYGTNPQNKEWAARGGEFGTKALGGLREHAVDFEDYRLTQAENLLRALKSVIAQIDARNLVPIRPKTCITAEFVTRKEQVRATIKEARETITTAEVFLVAK